MAIYFNEPRREDDYEKHPITADEIHFLANLQKEMNTQSTMGTADPRYWVIKGKRKNYGIDDEYAEGMELINSDGDSVADGMEEIYNYLLEYRIEDIKETYGLNSKIEFLSESNYIVINGETDSDILVDIDDVINMLENFGYDDYRTANYTIEDYVYPNTMFLTYVEAESHLKANYYHYDKDAHPYCMMANRAPDVEKLYNILHHVDFEALLVGLESLSNVAQKLTKMCDELTEVLSENPSVSIYTVLGYENNKDSYIPLYENKDYNLCLEYAKECVETKTLNPLTGNPLDGIEIVNSENWNDVYFKSE